MIRSDELRNRQVTGAPATHGAESMRTRPGDRPVPTNQTGQPRLTSRQQTVYGAVRRSYQALEEPVREAYLVRRTGMTRQAIKVHLAALAKKGLVKPGTPTIPR